MEVIGNFLGSVIEWLMLPVFVVFAIVFVIFYSQ